MRRVVISSWEALTVFGNTRETWDALLSGRAIEDHTRIPTIHGDDRALKLAHGVTLALASSDLRDAALIVGTSKGSIEEWLPAQRGVPRCDQHRRGLAPSGLGDIAFDLQRTLGMRGPAMTLSAACASGLYALARATMMIESGEVDRALVVATEASVHPLFIGSFQRLGILAKPGERCRPFDSSRTGFYMTEAAAAVMLEAANSSSARGSVYVDRFALGGDATHLTANDPEATLLKRLLSKAIDSRPVDLIHAHGTGTVLNDAIELAAIEDAVTRRDESPTPIVYSHKAALGHSLGASGLLSVVINCQAHVTGSIPPNPCTSESLPAGRVNISRTVVRRPVGRSIAIASGFGGATAVISLQIQ